MEDPLPVLRELRERCPVAHSDEYDGFWVLSRYRDVGDAARDPARFTSIPSLMIGMEIDGRTMSQAEFLRASPRRSRGEVARRSMGS